eukprot:1592100-Rhodomonas_salina.1
MASHCAARVRRHLAGREELVDARVDEDDGGAASNRHRLHLPDGEEGAQLPGACACSACVSAEATRQGHGMKISGAEASQGADQSRPCLDPEELSQTYAEEWVYMQIGE